MINTHSALWNYLASDERSLIKTGEYLLAEGKSHKEALADYSYIVFPFAKAYEGFLKQLFLEKKFITEDNYKSDHFRIGKALNPHLVKELPEQSVYLKITNFCQSEECATLLWSTWKRGRNLLFHYFPGNPNSINLQQAEEIVNQLFSAMEKTLVYLKVSEKG